MSLFADQTKLRNGIVFSDRFEIKKKCKEDISFVLSVNHSSPSTGREWSKFVKLDVSYSTVKYSRQGRQACFADLSSAELAEIPPS